MRTGKTEPTAFEPVLISLQRDTKQLLAAASEQKLILTLAAPSAAELHSTWHHGTATIWK